MMQYTRLVDPDNVASSPRQLKDCQDKVNACMTRLFRQPAAGGNPFLFALCGPKPHRLARKIGGQDMDTAATDGKVFYWNPDFLESLSPEEVATVMSHESYHVLFFHCAPERSGGLDGRIWNIAVDYVVNSTIETEHEKSGRAQKYKVWTGPLQNPIELQQYIDWIDGKIDDLPEKGCFADVTVYGRSPESIYEQIRKAMINSPRKCKEHSGGCGAMTMDPKTGISTIPQPWDPDACQKCGAKPNQGGGPGSLDSHLPSSQTKEETLGDMMRAADQTRAMGRGSVPEGIEAALGRLKKPELSARDIIKMAIAQKRADMGNINDWKRFRRRPSYIYAKDESGNFVPQHRLYTPRKHDYCPRWVCLMDTSGSMSDEDIANGVKELQLVSDIAEGWIVPCDAQPYWDRATKVNRSTDLQRTAVVGRGGTVFEQFFRELPKQKFGDRIDLVIILTDGDCDQVPTRLMPQGADCLWIITNKREFKPNFGRVAQLHPTRQ